MIPPEQKDLGLTVLIVDDQEPTRSMLKSILRGLGYFVISAENGRAAVEKLQSEAIDVIVCDWNMPGYSGLDVLRFVRSTDEMKGLPFIMLTAEAYRESVKTAIDEGVDDYIIKPFTSDILSSKIERLLRKKKKQ